MLIEPHFVNGSFMFLDPVSGLVFCLRCLRRARYLPVDWLPINRVHGCTTCGDRYLDYFVPEMEIVE